MMQTVVSLREQKLAGGYRTVICLFNSNGLDLSAAYGFDLVVTAPVVRDGNDVNAAYSFSIKSLDEIDTAALAKEAVKRSVQKSEQYSRNPENACYHQQ